MTDKSKKELHFEVVTHTDANEHFHELWAAGDCRGCARGREWLSGVLSSCCWLTLHAGFASVGENRMPVPEYEREMREALQRIGDKLVQLGYAQRILFEDTPQIVTVLWTESGRCMKRELQRIFEAVAK